MAKGPKIVSLKDEKIIDRWSMVIKDAQGKGERVYQETMRHLEEFDAPGVKVERVRLRPSALKDLRGYLMVTNEKLRDYQMYIGARDYGNALHVSWYMTCEPGFFKRALSSWLTKGASEQALSFSIDLFDLQDLQAYGTIVHHCLIKTVEDLMMGLGQDTSEIDRKSKGFLGIS